MKEEETTDHTDGRRGMTNNELIHTDLRESILGVALTLLIPCSVLLLPAPCSMNGECQISILELAS